MDQQKASASMVGKMFVVTTMSYCRERFIEVSIEYELLGTIPWYVMAVCSVAWKAVVMVMA